MHYFRGFQVFRDNTGIYLNQQKYVRDLLAKTNMTDAKPQSSPMCPSLKLSLASGTPLADPTTYRSIVGALQYLTMSRPDLSYSVNKLSQYLKAPTDVHWSACKRVLRYLVGTPSLGLHFHSSSPFDLQGYADADWAGCLDDRRSTSGYCVFLAGNLISWCSKKQTVIARSSAESEYRSLALATSEIIWVQSLLQELSIDLSSPPVIWCDNISAASLASNPVFHARTKHIEVDIHFVRDRVLDKKLEVRYVDTMNQIADVLTKPLHIPQFQALRDKLSITLSPVNLRGGVGITELAVT